MHVVMNFAAPVCFNATSCEEESVSDDLLSFEQCCFESSGVSFASPGQCLTCPQTGNLKTNSKCSRTYVSMYCLWFY